MAKKPPKVLAKTAATKRIQAPVEYHPPRISTEDRRDARIAQKRLEEIRLNPEKVLRGAALGKKAKQGLSY